MKKLNFFRFQNFRSNRVLYSEKNQWETNRCQIRAKSKSVLFHKLQNVLLYHDPEDMLSQLAV